MKPREALLERRKQYLKAKIAAQRAQLEWQLGAFRAPMQAFEAARGIGESLRRHAPLVGVTAAALGMLVMRGNLLSKTLRTVSFANKATRWWAVIRLGMQFAQRWRATPV
jgi:hypothetical protein